MNHVYGRLRLFTEGLDEYKRANPKDFIDEAGCKLTKADGKMWLVIDKDIEFPDKCWVQLIFGVEIKV